jgi:hypothetical protein
MIGFAALAFAACSNNDDSVYDPNRSAQGDKYASAFMKEFGIDKIPSDINWGFEKPAVANFDAEGKFTGFTRGVYPNSNQWGMYINVPTEMTQDQKDKVTKFFTEQTLTQGISVNWSDFFVHNVSSTDKGPYMNQLCCGTKDFEKRDHVLNFNAGSSTSVKNVGISPKNDGSQNCNEVDYYDGIQLVQDSGTELFAFHNSYDSKWYDHNFIMISGEMIDEAYPEAPSVAGMYFVGFDYEHNIDGRIENRDNKFNDWIIRVSPGFYKNAERVFVEDLIATKLEDVQSSDWDFNDVVFDVYFEDKWENGGTVRDAIITLRAAGGILPLTVAGKDVHVMMNQPQNVMINTNAGQYGKAADGVAPAIFRARVSNNATANDIKVLVNGATELVSVQGEATQKLCGPSSVDWCNEKVNIKTVQSNFVPYVKKQASKWHNR